MTDAQRIEALLDLVDPTRKPEAGQGQALAVLGLAEAVGRSGYRPTNAGWALLGDRGRTFRPL